MEVPQFNAKEFAKALAAKKKALGMYPKQAFPKDFDHNAPITPELIAALQLKLKLAKRNS